MFLRLARAVLILPGTVAVLVPGLLLWTSRGTPWASVPASPASPRFLAALLAAAIGLGLSIWTMVLFGKRGKGTPAPWDPPKHLVVAGPYRHMRNPMITGVLFLLASEALATGSWLIAGWMLLFCAANAVYFPFFEERGLQARFGAEYLRYLEHVPRWLPRLSPWTPDRSLATDEAYDLWAKSYDSDENPMIAMCEMAIRKTLPDVKGLHVVELGCGTGRNLLRLEEAGAASIIGMDFSEGMLARAVERGLPRSLLLRHDIRSPSPLPDSSADLVLFSLVLEHVENLGPPLADAARILRPGGLLFLSEIHPYLSLKGTAAHFEDEGTTCTMPTFPHDLGDFINEAGRVGFVLDRLDEWRPTQEAIAATPKVQKHGDVPLLVSMIFHLG